MSRFDTRRKNTGTRVDVDTTAVLMLAGRPPRECRVRSMSEYSALIDLAGDIILPRDFHMIIPAIDAEIFVHTVVRDGRRCEVEVRKVIGDPRRETRETAARRRMIDLWDSADGTTSDAPMPVVAEPPSAIRVDPANLSEIPQIRAEMLKLQRAGRRRRQR